MGWDRLEVTANKGPWQLFWMAIAILVPMFVILWVLASVMGWFGEAAQVAREEFGPRAMLEKYEWFKSASAELDKKRADIKVYSTRMSAVESSYAGTVRTKWDRTDKEQYNLWQSELAGVKASYNGLAAEYNAQMAKFNWAFANAGQLPQGASQPLPREYKPYTEE